LTRTAIYARYSSDNQREESIAAQVRACTDYARGRGYTIVKTFADEARTATTDDRPAFLDMIQAAKTGLFDVVIVHKLDRFARDRYDSAFYKRELRLAGVRLESVLEHLDDSPESIILESVLEGMAEYYSKNLAREVMKGMKENALECKHNGGIPPLGWDVDPETRRYVINEREAATVRLVFDLASRGSSYNTIREELNRRGMKTKLGRPFGKNAIHDILRNRKYMGIYIFNRSAPKTGGKRNHHKSKDPDQIIEIPGGMPAIIEERVFQEVQKMLDSRKHARARYKAKVTYLLAGLIYCQCGAAMTGNSSSYRTSGGTVRQHYYECNKANRIGDCNAVKIRKELVEKHVLTDMEKVLFSPEAIPTLAQRLHNHSNKEQSEAADALVHLEREIKRLDVQIGNLVSVLAEGAGGQVSAIVERLKTLENQKRAMADELDKLRTRCDAESLNLKAIISYLTKQAEILKNRNPDACRRLINTFVERINVSPESTEVIYKITTVVFTGGGGPYLVKTTVSTQQFKKRPRF